MKQLRVFIMLVGWWLLLSPTLTRARPAVPATPDTAAVTDTAKVKEGWWTVGAEVSSNSSFFGRNTAQRFPYTAATVTYVHRTGIWGSVMAYKLFATDSYIDETDLSLGYSIKIKDLVETNISYSRFIFGKNTPMVKAGTSNIASARFAVDWGMLYTGLTTSYIFGGNHDMFTVLENSRFIPLNPLWNGRHVIGIDPKVTITAGTQRFYETHTNTVRNSSSGLLTGGKPSTGNPLGGILDPTGPGNGNNSSGGTGNGNSGSGTTTTTTTEEVNRFNVLNYELKLPVVMYWGNFELEPAYRYAIPVNKIEGDESKAQSFYTFNISYTF